MGVLSRSVEAGSVCAKSVASNVSTRAATVYTEWVKKPTEGVIERVDSGGSLSYCTERVFDLYVQVSEALEGAAGSLKPSADQVNTTITAPLVNLFAVVDEKVATPAFDTAVNACTTTKYLCLRAGVWADKQLLLGKAVEKAKNVSKCLDCTITGGRVESSIVNPVKTRAIQYDDWLLKGAVGSLVNEFQQMQNGVSLCAEKKLPSKEEPEVVVPEEKTGPVIPPVSVATSIIPPLDSEESGVERKAPPSSSKKKKKSRKVQ